MSTDSGEMLFKAGRVGTDPSHLVETKPHNNILFVSGLTSISICLSRFGIISDSRIATAYT